MERKIDPMEKTFYQRAIQTKIGQTLRAEYGQDFLAQPLSQRLSTLLTQLNEQQNDGRGEQAEQHEPAR